MGTSSKHGGFSIAMFAYQVQAGLVVMAGFQTRSTSRKLNGTAEQQ